MADPNQPVSPNTPQRDSGALFGEPTRKERTFPTAALSIAAAVVLLLIVIFALMSRRHGNAAGSPDTLQPLAAYAPHIKLSNLQMSESTSFSGGKSTFIDGRITNDGPATVTGVTAQVLFATEGGSAPQLETVPVNLVRTRQPYLDTQPISAAPLAPGASADFRLIFEGIRPEWDQQTPEIHLTEISTR